MFAGLCPRERARPQRPTPAALTLTINSPARARIRLESIFRRPNEEVQKRGRLRGPDASESRHAGPLLLQRLPTLTVKPLRAHARDLRA